MIRLEIKNKQYDISKEAAKISTLPSGKIDKYEYLTSEETLPSNQRQIIEQAKFTFEKSTEKQVDAIKSLDPSMINYLIR